MSIVTVEAQLQAFLLLDPSIGTVTTEPLDSDGVPREARGQRFWMLEVKECDPPDQGRSYGTTEMVVSRSYRVHLEGWHGFSGTSQITTEWKTLVGTIIDRLEAANIPPSLLPIPGLYRIGPVGFSGLEVRKIRDTEGNTRGIYRAHHVLITFTVSVTERIPRN
jgi:hypothetical protein